MKIDNSFNEKNIYNTTSTNNSDALSKVKFRNMLAELLASTETTDEEEDTTKKTTTASLAGGIGAFPMMGMRMMPPPPPETVKFDLEELIEKAIEAYLRLSPKGEEDVPAGWKSTLALAEAEIRGEVRGQFAPGFVALLAGRARAEQALAGPEPEKDRGRERD